MPELPEKVMVCGKMHDGYPCMGTMTLMTTLHEIVRSPYCFTCGSREPGTAYFREYAGPSAEYKATKLKMQVAMLGPSPFKATWDPRLEKPCGADCACAAGKTIPAWRHDEGGEG